MQTSTQRLLKNQQLQQAMRAALTAQLALWDAIGDIETNANLPNDGDIAGSLEEFAIGIDQATDITDAMVNQAIAWLCCGEEIS